MSEYELPQEVTQRKITLGKRIEAGIRNLYERFSPFSARNMRYYQADYNRRVRQYQESWKNFDVHAAVEDIASQVERRNNPTSE